MVLLLRNRHTSPTTEWASKMPSIKSQVYKQTTMAAWSWRGRQTHANILLRITRVPQLSNNNTRSISKTRIIEITINYIAIDMRARIQRIRATSKWLSHLTISMIMPPEPPIIATVGEARLKELKGSTLIAGWKEQIRASCWLAQALHQVVPRRYPCRTLTIKAWQVALWTV